MEAVAEHGRLAPFFAATRWVMAAITVALATRAAFFADGPVPLALHIALISLVLVGVICLTRMPQWLVVVGVWLLIVVWALAACFDREAIFIAFPLFFIALALLPGWHGLVAVVATAGLAIALLGAFSSTNTAGATIGIVLAAGVAVLVAYFIRALQRDAHAQAQLITELQETRQALSDAERAAAVHGERERLARDVHDTVSQSLASVGMLLHAADSSVAAGNDPRPRIAQARETAQVALSETRALVRELTDADHRPTGSTLVAALERLAHDAMARADLNATVTVHGIGTPLPTSLEVALLRVAQGAVANVVRHAGATRLQLALEFGETITMSVVDNGHGFDDSAAGFGITSMRSRMHELGGTVEIRSSTDGTRVIAKVRNRA